MRKVSLTRPQRRVLGAAIIAVVVMGALIGALAPRAGVVDGVLVFTDQSLAAEGSSQGQTGESWETAIVLDDLGELPVKFDHTSKHVIVRGARFAGDTVGIDLAHASNVHVEVSSFDSCGTGIAIAAGSGIAVTGNTFDGCLAGLSIDAENTGTAISLNNFTGNTVVAYDASSSSLWTAGGLGNFYADYMDEFPASTLVGNDTRLASMFDQLVGGAFMGSEPYLIPISDSITPTTACDKGSHGGQIDCFPLVFVPNHHPQIALNTPLGGSIFGNSPPTFNITAAGKFVTNVSYAINGIPFPVMTGFSLFGCQTFLGTINPAAWAALPSGFVNISCQVKTWFGKVASTFVMIEKDISDPVIDIHAPLPGSVHAGVAPSYNITIADAYIANRSYRIGSSDALPIDPSGVGMIDALAWTNQPEGEQAFVVTVTDTMANTRVVSVPLFKDLTPPVLSVAFPKGTHANWTVHGIISPSFTLTASDAFPDQCWYEVAGVPGTFSTGPSGSIDAGAWASKGNGTVTITFHANDTMGHESTLQVTLFKDITSPVITILAPLPWQVLGTAGPSFTIDITEGNLALAWISVAGASANYSISGCSGVIPPSIWGQSANGTVEITFFANDSAGNLGFASVTVHHDVIAPVITVFDPITSFTYGLAPPPYNLSIQDGSLAFVRYSIDAGATWFDLPVAGGLTGTIDAGAWHTVPLGNWTFCVQAGDLGGNEASVTVRCIRDPAPPLIQVLSPTGGVFGNSSVPLHLTLVDDYLDHAWYTLNGTAGQYSLPSVGDIEAIVDVAAWLECPDGDVSIVIFANDTLGSEENVTLVVTKDTTPASIAIASPVPGTLFSIAAPEIEFSISEAHWNRAQVTIDGYSNVFLITPGQLDLVLGASFWTSVPDGLLTIRLAVNDTVGNFRQTSVQIRKDTTAPVMWLAGALAPLWGTDAPAFTINMSDANPASAHYTIDGTSTQYDLVCGPSMGVGIDPVAWGALADGMHVFTITGTDEGGLCGSVTVSLEKDATGPLVAIQSLADGDSVTRAVPHLCVVVEDAHLTSIQYSLDGGQSYFDLEACGVLGSIAWGSIFSPGESITILVRATDAVNNTGTASVTVICAMDTSIPRVDIDTMLLLVLVVLVSILVGLRISEKKGSKRSPKEFQEDLAV